ncbi:MAG: hypothetical protein AAF387_14085 [Pseudomonadota bacterium]
MYADEEHNFFYKRNGDGIELSGERVLKAAAVFVMNSDAIHAIVDPNDTVIGALHVYGGSLMTRPGRNFWYPDTSVELAYDQLAGYRFLSQMLNHLNLTSLENRDNRNLKAILKRIARRSFSLPNAIPHMGNSVA